MYPRVFLGLFPTLSQSADPIYVFKDPASDNGARLFEFYGLIFRPI